MKKIGGVKNRGPFSFVSKCIQFGVPLAFKAFGWFRIVVPIVVGAVLFWWGHTASQDWKDNLSVFAWSVPLSAFIVIALVAIFCAPYYLWKQICNERDSLNSELVTLKTPWLKVECSTDIDGCRKENQRETGFNQAFRVAVTTVGIAPVTGCRGQLREIKRGASTLWGGDTAILAFAPGDRENPNPRNRTIAHDEIVFLDVLFLEYDKNWSFVGSWPATENGVWNFMPKWHEIFANHGEYTLKIEIVNPPNPTLKFDLKFNWTGDKTSRMDLIT